MRVTWCVTLGAAVVKNATLNVERLTDTLTSVKAIRTEIVPDTKRWRWLGPCSQMFSALLAAARNALEARAALDRAGGSSNGAEF